MIWNAPVDNGDVPIPTRIATLANWGMIQVQVRGAPSVFIAKSRDELMAQPNAGIEIRAQDAPLEFHWRGEIWGLGGAKGALIDIQIHE